MRFCKALCGRWLPDGSGSRRKYCLDAECRRAGEAKCYRTRYATQQTLREKNRAKCGAWYATHKVAVLERQRADYPLLCARKRETMRRYRLAQARQRWASHRQGEARSIATMIAKEKTLFRAEKPHSSVLANAMRGESGPTARLTQGRRVGLSL